MGIAQCNVYYRQEDSILRDDDCADLVVAYRSMFAIQCVELDEVLRMRRHKERKGSPRLHADFDCETKMCIYRDHSNSHANTAFVVLLEESILSFTKSADFHVGVGLSTHAFPVRLSSCFPEGMPHASIVISDDQLVGLDRTQSSELLLPALHEIWRWPGLVERLPKKKTATGLTTSQVLRLLEHCAELPAESQTLFTLFWMNESALQVRCSDVTTAVPLHTRDPRGDTAGKSHVCDRFATHWNPEGWLGYKTDDQPRLATRKRSGLFLRDGRLLESVTGDLSKPSVVTELAARLGKGFLPGLDGDPNPLQSGHVLSKVSCCTDDGSLRWHSSAVSESFEPFRMCPLSQLHVKVHNSTRSHVLCMAE